MRKINEENERIKRRYLQYLKVAKRKDQSTVHKAAEGILRFEASTNYDSFKRFRLEHAIKFHDRINSEVSKTTGKPLSKSTISSVLAANKGFIFWLADQAGYKSRIRHSDADYFNMDSKGARIAHTVRETPYPSMEQARHAFNYMPDTSVIERRNKAMFAFLMLTGARDGAVASLRLKHINMIDGCVYQDAREVKTKNSKTITTYFLPVDLEYQACFDAWVVYLKSEALFGPDDPLFPPPKMAVVEGGFQIVGLKRDIYQNANAIRQVTKQAFTRADLHPFTPHAFRKTLVKWADTAYPTREAFKAFSQNIGHTSVVTTISAYCPVSNERQAELVKRPKKPL
ncbi:site-specific tyrosine recombinase XerC [Thalassovita gelatinovora]|uniref:Site-specific tyrosine recombinase XerC n=1 Tax=Thalassovita gelatinovora TaxID=53501 RepID=A0A0P1FC50_THAGE|nr:site-specific integrase [Thalassovita gelatinovora]QIZ80033.1 site-specific integrase [Thalassovita gelatinovora]CUH65737.1 site-specific tyrosine recombinase XerC [Thalassovita gelatinovora]SER04151.1 Site-specific recombinase XerD [Thalassovita gelatinovora]